MVVLGVAGSGLCDAHRRSCLCGCHRTVLVIAGLAEAEEVCINLYRKFIKVEV